MMKQDLEFEAFLKCKSLSKKELLLLLYSKDKYLRFASARRLQFFNYNEIKRHINKILYEKHYFLREVGVYIIGQMQSDLSKNNIIDIKDELESHILYDKSIRVKSTSIFSLAHMLDSGRIKCYKDISYIIEKVIPMNNHSIKMALVFLFSSVDINEFIFSYLINILNDRSKSVVSWAIYALDCHDLFSHKIEMILIKRLNKISLYDHLYDDISVFLLKNKSEEIIPYVEVKLLNNSMIDERIIDAIGTEKKGIYRKLIKIIDEKFERN